LGNNKDLNYIDIKNNYLHVGAATPINDLIPILKNIYRCDCSLCIKKGIIMKPLPKEKFSLIQGKEFLNSYKWNKKIAEHFFCNICGVYTHHQRRRDPDQYSVNLGCLEGVKAPEEKHIDWVDGSSHS
jgi:hypothetical protein